MTQEKAIAIPKHMARVLKEEGVEYVFGVCGGHIWGFPFAASLAGIKLVHVRHEQAGGYVADGYARASGKVGVCFGTAGPGMTNQISAIAQAQSAKVPMVAFYGQHQTSEDGRNALQEGYAEKAIGQYTKWVTRLIDPSLAAYITKKAFRDAMTYPQGPVAIEVPANLWPLRTTVSDQQGFVDNSYTEPAPTPGDPASIEKAVKALLAAERPIIAGGEAIFWSHAEDELKEFVELTQIPVITRRTGRGAIPEDHPLAFSGRARSAILRGSDIACTIGLNLGYLEGYGAWAKGRKLIQITESKGDIEFTAPSYLIIIANPRAALKQMIECAKELIKGSPRKEAWLKTVNDIKAADRKRVDDEAEAHKNSKPIHPAWMAAKACEVLDKDSTVIFDALTGSAFMTERFQAKHSGSVLDAGNTAGVGHGVGMGIGAQLARPGKQVLVVMGDGGMGIGGMDIETAVRSELPVVYMVNNNNGWMCSISEPFKPVLRHVGNYDDGYNAFPIYPTNYAKMFEACGAYGIRVEDPSEMLPALYKAFDSGKTTVLDVVVDPKTRMQLSPPSIKVLAESWMGGFIDPEDYPEDVRKKAFPDEG